MSGRGNCGLGRLHAPDPRDRRFLLQAVQPPLVVTRNHRYWIVAGEALDQGATSMCVAYAGTRYLTANPIRNLPMEPGHLYDLCQLNDEWPGEDYDGTSVRALFRVLKMRGLVSEYRWAFDVMTVARHLLTVGPVILGTNWYDAMFEPDADGFLQAEGPVVGGHAYLAVGCNVHQRKIQILNSWGPRWGSRGRAWVSFETLQRLIREDGEACVATEVRHVR